MSDAKVQVAKKAFEEMAPQINKESVLGIGTGSTVNCFIEILKQSNIHFKGPYLALRLLPYFFKSLM